MTVRLRMIAALGVAGLSALAPVGARADIQGSFLAKWKGRHAGRAIYDGMIETIKDAKSLSLESDYVWRTSDRELGHAVYRLWMKKPNYARLESRSADGAHVGILVLDGKELWTYWPSGRPPIPGPDTTMLAGTDQASFMRKSGEKGTVSLAHEVWSLGTGMSMTLLELSVFHGSADPLEEYLELVAKTGEERVDGEDCDVIEASYSKGERTRVFWVAKSDHLPRKLEETLHLKRDIITSETWTNVALNGEIKDDLFSWRPPASWVEFKVPSLEDGLLKPGVQAPDFDAALADGGRFRLSENRGRFVWLFFWKIECPPCREEMPYLSELTRRYAGADLVIIGFNATDDADLATKYARKRRYRFPVIVDPSPAGQEVSLQKYQTVKGMSAVPLNYIIDREGRVVDAWYGYRTGDDRGLRSLRKLGVAR
jgi:peroxiredoxin/outer membrane lipoprotein-sorting protein